MTSQLGIYPKCDSDVSVKFCNILYSKVLAQNQQETAKDGMAGLQSGNKIWETDWEQA